MPSLIVGGPERLEFDITSGGVGRGGGFGGTIVGARSKTETASYFTLTSSMFTRLVLLMK